jgi:hypothetical protein
MWLRFKRVGSRAEDPTPVSARRVGVRRVLVSYEPSPLGRAALLHAMSVARDAGADLMVVSVAAHERADAGCARCRESAAIWNREMRSLAVEAVMEAASLVGPSRTVEYRVGYGQPIKALVRPP